MAIIALFLLASYLTATRLRLGKADMISDTFYQLEAKRKGLGFLFSLTMTATALLMLPAMLGMGKGVQCFAFLGCGGLMFVGAAPNYLSQDEYPIHKGGAIVAAIGCVGWCLTVCWWPTVAIGSLYALYMVAKSLYKSLDNVWWISSLGIRWHPWYWAEVACFADVFATYFAAHP